ncbi:S10 family peptidase [Caulobacter sp. NIBR2454]|uniref:S10 family peptidase n=1 Tax=Caulobacter sp. NIBR2454 TaxID=3015996 RepID=UPI0022B67499|nr:peptidase S10 [Caulobacter sp. NIBR2454]
MRKFAVLASMTLAMGLSAPVMSWAQDAKPAEAAKKEEKSDLPPLPADASAKQSMRVGGKVVNYTATVGTLPVRDAKGKKTAEVVFTSYTVEGAGLNRPVTFAFNGGPGAASVYLNMGAIGPKRVQFGAQGDAPSDSAVVTDNPGTWLDFTDLVFIDPVGTGFSRSLVSEDESKKAFYGVDQDINYLSRIVYDWLVKNGRMTSPKYITGESYGGFRGPRLTHKLQTELGVGINGVILVSPFFDGTSWSGGDYSPIPWSVTLPSMAAANYERQGKTLNQAQMQEVEDYARGEFMTDFMRGYSDPAVLDRLSTKVAGYTGLPRDKVREWGGRIDSRAFLRELYRKEGKIGSWYDSNVTAPDPFPWSPEQRTGDAILDALIAPTTSAYVDFATRQVGWKYDGRYYALSYDVNRLWENRLTGIEAVTAFRRSLANDLKMKVLIVHGYDDLSCPYFSSRIVIDQLPQTIANNRVQLKAYPGGHMFYSRSDSGSAMRADVMALYGAR